MSCTWTTVHVHELTSVVSLKPSLPLVRFCPHSAWPCLPPQCGRPLWMTPNSVTYETVSCVTFAVSQLLYGAYLHVTIRSDFTLTHLSDDYIQLASFLCSPTPRYYDFLYSPHSQTCQSLLSSDTHTVQLNVFIHSFIHSFIQCSVFEEHAQHVWVVSGFLWIGHRLWTHVSTSTVPLKEDCSCCLLRSVSRQTKYHSETGNPHQAAGLSFVSLISCQRHFL